MSLKTYALAVCALAIPATLASANTLTQNFDGSINLSPNQAPGTWYTDRYAPAVFESGVMFNGDNRLRQGVRSGDNQASRTAEFSDDRYNYQGRKYDAAPQTYLATIDIYVNSAWNSGTRAGMWTTMSNGNLTYPIIEYVVDGDIGGSSFTGFRYWQSHLGWTASSFANPGTDQWYTIQIELTATQVLFTIDGVQIGAVDNQGAYQIDNVILQAHNQGLAGDYDVYWDNFTLTAVPTPAAAGMGMLGLGLVAARRRRA